MDADDDGIVDAYTVIKAVGSKEDTFKVLVARQFVLPLNEDDITYILDWNEHNLIRPDRKVDSIYQHLLVRVLPDVELIEPKERADRPKNMGRPRDYHGAAQVRLGKVRIGKPSKAGQSPAGKPSFSQLGAEVIQAFEELNPIAPQWYNNTTQRAAADRLIEIHGLETVLKVIALLQQTNKRPYMPSITTPRQLEEKWAELRNKLEQEKAKGISKKSNVI